MKAPGPSGPAAATAGCACKAREQGSQRLGSADSRRAPRPQLAELEALNAELEDANTQLEAVALAAGAQRDAARAEAEQAAVRPPAEPPPLPRPAAWSTVHAVPLLSHGTPAYPSDAQMIIGVTPTLRHAGAS